MNKRHYEHTLPNIRGSLSNTYLAAISYLIITVNKIQSPIPLVTEPGLLSSVSDSNSGYMKAGNRPLLHFVESWQENQSFQACRFLSLHCRHPML